MESIVNVAIQTKVTAATGQVPTGRFEWFLEDIATRLTRKVDEE